MSASAPIVSTRSTFIHSVDQALIAKKDLSKLWIGSDGRLLEQTWWRRAINWFTGSYDKQTARMLTAFGHAMTSQGLHEKGDLGAFYRAFSARVEKKEEDTYKNMRAAFSSVFPLEQDQTIQQAFADLKDNTKSPRERNTALTTLLNQPEGAVVIDSTNGNTPLHYVISYEKEGKLQEILGERLSAYMQVWKDVPNAAGMTPFLMAAQQGNLNGIKLLEAHEVNTGMVDREGNNFWHHVFIGTTNTNLAETFLKHMVDKHWSKDQLMAFNKGGFSPFHLAFVNNNKGFIASMMAPLTADDRFAAYENDLEEIAQQQTRSGKTAIQLLAERFKKQGSDPGSDIHFLLLCLVTRFPVSEEVASDVQRARLPLRLEMLVTGEGVIKYIYSDLQQSVARDIDFMKTQGIGIEEYIPKDEKPVPEEEQPTINEQRQPITDFIGEGKTSNWWRSFLTQDKGKLLLQKGKDGLTPLHHALRKEDTAFLEVVCDPARKYELVDWTLVGKLNPPIADQMSDTAAQYISTKLPEAVVRKMDKDTVFMYYVSLVLFEKQRQAKLYQAAREKAASARS